MNLPATLAAIGIICALWTLGYALGGWEQLRDEERRGERKRQQRRRAQRKDPTQQHEHDNQGAGDGE